MCTYKRCLAAYVGQSKRILSQNFLDNYDRAVVLSNDISSSSIVSRLAKETKRGMIPCEETRVKERKEEKVKGLTFEGPKNSSQSVLDRSRWIESWFSSDRRRKSLKSQRVSARRPVRLGAFSNCQPRVSPFFTSTRALRISNSKTSRWS